MTTEIRQVETVNSVAEDEFVRLFCETFGVDKAEQLFVQYPCVDIYGRHRWIDFALETSSGKIAIEIDGTMYHDPAKKCCISVTVDDKIQTTFNKTVDDWE